jgi:hypothetical protein
MFVGKLDSYGRIMMVLIGNQSVRRKEESTGAGAGGAGVEYWKKGWFSSMFSCKSVIIIVF